jgi:outer membrane murein-binding lipoprotein Lpp
MTPSWHHPCRFLCTGCRRTRRPPVADIQKLLAAADKLPMDLPHVTELAAIVRAAGEWAARARAALDIVVAYVMLGT